MHPARSASVATRNQAPRSHAGQGKKMFIGEGEELKKPLFSQRLLEEMGFCSARVQSALWKAKLKRSQAQAWGGRGCQPLAVWTLWGSGCCLTPGGREAGPLHRRDIPGEDTHHPLLWLGAGHISSGADVGQSWASPAASPLLVLAFLKAPRG